MQRSSDSGDPGVPRQREAPPAPENLSQMLRELVEALPFPDPSGATEAGLLAYGGDLGAERLLAAYAQGVFPWYEDGPILWFSPDPRMVVMPAEIRVNRSLAKTFRRARYDVRFDTAFEEVIRHCADTPRPDQDGTWINDDMIRAYCALHELGFAHSIESFADGQLVGGLYGVSLGTAFFGESMFAHEADASKVAIVCLARQLESWGFDFIDCQVHTEHLERFGAVEWPRDEFLARLRTALESNTRRGPWRASEDLIARAAEPRDEG